MSLDQDPTCIGRVKHVLGATVTVALDADLAGIAPIYRGQVLSVGQIGSLVRIPQGPVELIASVVLVGISELVGAVEPLESLQRDERWLQVQLLGEIDKSLGKFRRGVGTYPGLDDPVHFAVAEDLRCVFPDNDEKSVRIGVLASAEDLPISVDLGKLVTRHAAIVGSTGAGKTSAVASILQAVVRGGWTGANIIVIDPHGEYSSALGDSGSVLSVLGSKSSKLKVPYWALPALDLPRIFAGAVGGPTLNARLLTLVTEAKRKFAAASNWLSIDSAAITCDTPIPFDIEEIWYQLEYENGETRDIVGDPKSASIVDKGNASELKPPQFKPYSLGSLAPFKGPSYGMFGMIPAAIRLGLLNPKLSCFGEPRGTVEGPDPLVEVVSEWLGGDRPISVLDFSGVPAEAADLAIGVVLDLLFELCQRSDSGGPGLGRPSPLLVVLEEAHRYLGPNASVNTRNAANKIAREGRKYGAGLVLVTQRPSDLPDTALAQCGTLISLRLTNSVDQGTVRAALPDNVSNLASVLPSLRTGEAVVSGEAVVLPVRVLLSRPDPSPKADDASLQSWRDSTGPPDIAVPLASWREMYSG